MSAFDAVIFDWGGTLTPWHTVDLLDCWLAVTGDPRLAQALHSAENSLWIRSRDDHLSATLDEVVAAAGCALTAAQRRAYFQWWEAHTHTDPEAEPMLRGLRDRGLATGILSNTMWPRTEHERIFRRDGVLELIDGAVYSSEIARTKPHRSAFTAALAAVGVDDPARAIFVGDRLFDDIHGAQQVGMATIHVPHSDIPQWQTSGVYGTPDAVITSLNELLGILDIWDASGFRPTGR